MNWYKLFYWLTVADNAKVFFIVFIVIFTLISAVSWIIWFASFDDTRNDDKRRAERKTMLKWIFWSTPMMVLFWSLFVFTPSKRDSLLIIAGGGAMNFLTQDSASKQIPKELSNFVLGELKTMSQDVKVKLGVQTQKEKILDEAKKMTTDQLLEKMKLDSNFAKIILKE